MGYSSQWGENAESGGPFPDGPKGNTKRPQNYIGEYVTEIRYKGDGQQAVDPAPQQGFRKELPAPSKPGYVDAAYESSDATPTTQAEIYKAHR